MTPRPIRAMTAMAAAMTFLGGCYTYRPAELSEVAPESRVRVTVSTAQAVELADALRDVRRSFNATYVGESSGALLFSVPLRNPTPGMSSRGVQNRVAVPRAEISGLEHRELSVWRTATVIGAGVLALGYGAWEVFGGNSRANEEPKPPDVDNARIPLFSIPVGW